MICLNCKNVFNENSVNIVRFEQGLCVVKIVCQTCGKSFAVAFLGLDDLIFQKDLAKNDAPPITSDDVIDAHNFFKNLDADWMKYLNK